MKKFLLLLLLVPSLCFGDSESTIGGKTAQAHIIQSGGTSIRPRPYLDFEGGITCADTNGKSVCTSTSLAPITISNGNVGIGSLHPGTLLDVQGTVRAISFLGDGSQLTGIPQLWTQAGSNLNPTTVSGTNVGIGTSTTTGILTTTSTAPLTNIDINNANTLSGCDSQATVLSHYDSDINDAGCTSSGVRTGTATGGAAASASQFEFGGGSLSLNGSSQYVTYPDSADYIVGTSSFTVDTWVYLLAQPAANTTMQIGGQVEAAGAKIFRLDYQDSAGTKQIVGDSESGVNYRDIVTQTIGLNAWHHIAWVRNGSTSRIYYDGVQTGIDYSSSYNFTNIASVWYIGGNADFGQYFNGYIDEFRFSNGIARWTGTSFTPPTSAYAAGGSSDAIRFQDAGVTKFSMGYNGTSANQFEIGTTAIGTNTRFAIDANGNVGVNQALPVNKLDVSGNAAIGSYAGVNSAPSNGLIVQGNVGIGTTVPGSNLSVLGSASFGSYATSAAPTGGLIASGNVGVGTFAPISILHLQNSTLPILTFNKDNGGISTQGEIRFIGNMNSPTTRYSSIQGLTVNSSSNQNALAFDVGNQGTIQEAMRLDYSGNVGIGTTTPAGALTVMNGNVGIGTWVPSQPLVVGKGVFTVSSVGDIVAGTQISGTGFLLGGAGHDGNTLACFGVGVSGSCSSGHLYVKTGSASRVALRVDAATSQTADIIQADNVNGAVLSHIGANGNIGIGTTLSTNGLDVNGGVGIGTAYAGYQIAPANGLIVQGNVGIGTSLNGAKMNIGGACATQENVSMCIGKDANGIACIGYCTGVLGTCSACTCC